MAPINILLIDASTLFREGLKQLLPGDFKIISEARYHSEALQILTRAVDLHLILMDCPAPVLQEAITALNEAAPGRPIVHLTSRAELERLQIVLATGAAGYLTKDRSPEALSAQLRLVMLGQNVLPADLVPSLLAAKQRNTSPARGPLSPREQQILACLVRGATNKMIAHEVGITEATVKIHLKSILRKINVANRTQAAIWAMNNGINVEEVAA